MNKNELTVRQTFQIKFLSGLIGSITSVLICCPLDLVKVRLQISYDDKMKNYRSISQIIKHTYEKEGVKGFYKGLKAGITTSPIFYSIYFPIYENSKRYYSNYFYGNNKTPNVIVLSLSSLTAVIISDLCTTPMWVVRVRYQTKYLHDRENNVKESFNLSKEIKKLYFEEGFFSLYRGYRICLLGSPHIIVQFNIYEYITKKTREISDKKETPYKYVMAASLISKGKSI